MVNYVHCKDHRQGNGRLPDAPQRWPGSEEGAELLADILTDGIDAAVADRVVEYVGRHQRKVLTRQTARSSCKELADTARAVLKLKDQTHEVVAEGAAALLPKDTPKFQVLLVKKIAAKVPLPTDAHLEAIARGLQLMGIFQCMVLGLPMSACACLMMLGGEVMRENAKQYVEDLLEQSRADLEGRVVAPGPPKEKDQGTGAVA